MNIQIILYFIQWNTTKDFFLIATNTSEIVDDLISIILSRKNIYVYIVWSHFHDISEQAKPILDDRNQKRW